MATIGNSTPLLYVEGSATQISGSGTKRTVKITAKFKVNGTSSSAWYGYPCNWRARVHNSYGSYATMKGTESWYATHSLRTFEQTLEVDVGTTSSTNITVGIYTNHPDYNYWNGNYTWTFTVGSTNVAPVLEGTIGTNVSGTISESTTKIELTSPTATDGNNNLSGYRFAVSVNGGGYTEIQKSSSRTCSHTISGGEGTTYKYSCYAYDASGATSKTIESSTITKNKLTGATLVSSTTIGATTTSIEFTWSTPSNTNGNTTFSYAITSSDITVYRATSSTGTDRGMTIPIVKSAPSSGPYILKDDIINKFKGSSYKGTLNFTLATKNGYGTTKTSTKAITVNLQSKPVTPDSCGISTSSTARRQVVDTKNYYYIPDDTRTMTINWGSVTGAVGESISYDLEVAYGGSDSYGLLINTNSTSYEHKVGKQTVSRQISYRVRAKASYGTYGDYRTAQAETLHYYNSPSLTPGTITRGATTAEVVVTVKTNSSIPNINTVGTWERFATGTTTPVQQDGKLTVAQTAQTISTTGLTDEGLYDLKVTYNDGTGFSSDKATTIKIGANSPLFFVNKYGAGINGLKADANYALRMKGSIQFEGTNGTAKGSKIEIMDGNENGTGMIVQSGSLMVVGAGESPSSVVSTEGLGATSEHMYVTSDSNIYFKTNCNTIANRVTTSLDNSGNFGMVGKISTSKNTATYLAGNQGNALLNSTASAGSYVMFNRYPSSSGYFTMGGYQGNWLLQYTAKSTVDAETNSVTKSATLLNQDGNTSFPGTVNTANLQVGGNNVYHTGRKPSAADVGAPPSSTGGNITIHADSDSSSASEYLDLKAGKVKVRVLSNGSSTAADRYHLEVQESSIIGRANVRLYDTGSVWGFEPYRGGAKSRMAQADTSGNMRLELFNSSGVVRWSTVWAGDSYYPSSSAWLGHQSYRWGQIYSTVGSISTSDSKLKENIKKIAPTEKVALMSKEPTDTEATGEDMWNYIKSSGVYSFNYKKRYSSLNEKEPKEWLGVLADEIPDNIFNKIGLVSKTQEEYEELLLKQEEYKTLYQNELAKIPSVLTEEEAKEYDINDNYGNQIVEGTELTRRELKDKAEEFIEEPVRMLNSSAQIAMLQEVLSLALNKIETLENRIVELENK